MKSSECPGPRRLGSPERARLNSAFRALSPDDPILVEGTKEERQAHRRKIREVLKLVTQQLAEQDKEEEEERQRLGLPPLREEAPKKKRGVWG